MAVSRVTGRFRDSSQLAGWLFADFLLALGMLFLVGSTVGTQAPPDVPQITGFAPTTGPVGTSVRISGVNLKAIQDISFGAGHAQEWNAVSDSELIVTVPFSASTGLITLTTQYGVATSPAPFTVLVGTPTPTATPTPTPTPTATPSPTPTPSPTEPARIVEETCWSYIFQLGGNISRLDQDPVHAAVVQMLQDRFAEAEAGNRQAGFVLTFAQSTDDGSSTRAAQRLNDLLMEAAPEVFQTAAKKAYLARGRPLGQVEVQVYYLSGGGPITNAEPCRD